MRRMALYSTTSPNSKTPLTSPVSPGMPMKRGWLFQITVTSRPRFPQWRQYHDASVRRSRSWTIQNYCRNFQTQASAWKQHHVKLLWEQLWAARGIRIVVYLWSSGRAIA
ncbi:hypothetical protein C8Q77DRAFT_144657 [Trametes polyzona]|nr:hypothetical protein C8Q77DRAFT_144657 [Trametes polyzona]